MPNLTALKPFQLAAKNIKIDSRVLEGAKNLVTAAKTKQLTQKLVATPNTKEYAARYGINGSVEAQEVMKNLDKVLGGVVCDGPAGGGIGGNLNKPQNPLAKYMNRLA